MGLEVSQQRLVDGIAEFLDAPVSDSQLDVHTTTDPPSSEGTVRGSTFTSPRYPDTLSFATGPGPSSML